MKTISIVTGCYNEVDNIRPFYERCRAELAKHPDYDYEFVVADNLSDDGTRKILREIAAEDPKFKVIFNASNYGHIRSPFNALLNSSGELVFALCSDLQEPPEMLSEFLKKYEEGYKVICGVRSETKSSQLMECLRGAYYKILQKISPGQHIIQKFTGFGLYDRCFIEAVKKFNEPYPYLRGLVTEIGFPRVEVPFVQAMREHGVSKNNWLTLYDMAMTGVVKHSRVPLRLAVFSGFVLAGMSLLVALGYFIYKLLYWDTFQLGLAPLVIGMFFFSAIQLIFIGILGEYIGAIWIQVRNNPLVIEAERINFDK